MDKEVGLEKFLQVATGNGCTIPILNNSMAIYFSKDDCAIDTLNIDKQSFKIIL